MARKVYDLLWLREKKSEDKPDSKNRWETVGVLSDNDGKMSVKLNVLPVGNWDGYLTVKEREKKPAASESKS